MLMGLFLYGIVINDHEFKLNDTVRVNQYGQEVSWLSLNGEAREGILSFTSKDENYLFWFDNRIQFDMAAFSSRRLKA